MRALLVSKHHKEQSLETAFKTTGIRLEAFTDFDTDELGTFSGTITRKLSPFDAALSKAMAGRRAIPGFDWYIGSEGSFFPDPAVPFVTRQHELLLALPLNEETPVVAEKSGLIAWAIDREVNSEVEFQQLIKGAIEEGKEHVFISLVGAPPSERIAVESGAANLIAVYRTVSQNGSYPVQVISDLRAHRSSGRRLIIAEAAEKLAQKLICPCPRCNKLGFGMVRALPGLPCAWCLNPTSAVRATLSRCNYCGFQNEVLLPETAPYADPAICGVCNP